MGDQFDDADRADLAEQATPVVEDEDIVLDETGLEAGIEADDADRWEQAIPVGDDDEEDRERG